MNIGDLGQDLEHCLQLHRLLRKLRGVWAGVRGPCQCIPHQEAVTTHGLWSQMWALMSAPRLRPELA